MSQSKRFSVLAERPVNQDIQMKEWPEAGMVAMHSPYDPKPSLRIRDGKIVEMDRRVKDEFDCLDLFIADHSIDLGVAEEAMKMDSREFARQMIDIHADISQIKRLAGGMTPAKLCQVVEYLNVVELMMAQQRLQERIVPINQCQLANQEDNPVLIACDAAEAALRGFGEEKALTNLPETLSLCLLSAFIGSQCGRAGVLVQANTGEKDSFLLGENGLSGFVQPLAVQGTESTLIDDSDTPYSKMFLAAVYASRGIKVRYASGAGSEAQQGKAERKSMLYLQARSFLVTKGCGVQGTENSSLRSDGLIASVSAGVRELLAENVIAALLGLECVSGGGRAFTHSDLRRTANVLVQMLSGAGSVFSGYGMSPAYDLPDANFHPEDLDDCTVLQRDLQVDGGLRPVSEEETVTIRRKAARCLQSVFRSLSFPEITDEEVEQCALAHGSKDVAIKRNKQQDIAAAQRIQAGEISALDLIKGLKDSPYPELAETICGMVKQRLSGDCLHTAAFLNEQLQVSSSIDQLDHCQSPGNGPRMDEDTWKTIQSVSGVIDPVTGI